MTKEELITAGFKEFASQGGSVTQWDMLYQYRVRDQYGTRYFINVNFWQHSKYGVGVDDSFEAEITYNDGVVWQQGRACLQVKAWSVSDWSPQEVIRWADEMWRRLNPNYYERES